MKVRIRRLVISVLIWSVLNAGVVLLFEKVIGSVTAEVAVSTVFSLLWVVYAVIFCREPAEPTEDR